MCKKIIVFILLFQLLSSNCVAQSNEQIQIFDIKQNKVINYVNISKEIQQEVEGFLGGITGVYVKYNPIPDKGYMIRVPLEPTIMVRNRWFDDLVDEVTIIFAEEEDPYLMVFDDENNPYFLTFEGNSIRFRELLNFKPKEQKNP